MSLEIKWIGSKHKREDRGGFRPEAIVIHIMEGTLKGTDAWFNDKVSKVSAHYGIGQNGEIHQYVMEHHTAFHAGRKKNSTWKLLKPDINPNLYTIGIEHEGKADSPWSAEMYKSSAALVKDICIRCSIPIDRDHIIGHREIYAVKTCPGSVVDLNKLIKMAKAEALDDENFNFIKKSGSVAVRTKMLNIRRGAPTTAAAVVRKARQDEVIKFVGWTSSGQTVNGNSHWYRDESGNYFWAGGTNKPIPGL